MKRIVVIDKDKSILHGFSKAVESYVGEKIRLDIFDSIENFKEKYFNSKEEFSDSEKPEAAEKAPHVLLKTERHKKIDLLILSDEFLSDIVSQGVQFIFKKLVDSNYCTDQERTRFMITGYYSEELHLEDFENPLVVDFIFKPIDQQLLLQKLEVAFHLGMKVEPSYLAKASIKEPIAIGKLSKIEEISEFGLAIRNPKPIRPGQFARFYSKLFFCKTSPSLLARCYLNIPHPENRNEYLSYFSFFGIRREQLLNIRKQMQRDSHLEKSSAHAEAMNNIEKVNSSEIEKDIVVVDSDIASFNNIKEVYSKAFRHIHIHHYPTYSSFLRTLQSAKANVNLLDIFYRENEIGPYANSKNSSTEKSQAPKLTERYVAIPINDFLVLEVKKEDLALFRVQLLSDKKYSCFGLSFQEFKTDPQLWQSIIHEDSKEEWSDFLNICLSGQSVKTDLWGVSKDGSPARIRIEAEPKRENLNLKISDISLSFKGYDSKSEKVQYNKIYAVYMDGSIFREETGEFANNVRKAIKEAGFKPEKRKTKIVSIGLEDGTTRAHKYEKEEIDDFLYRPVDRNLTLQKLMIYVLPFEEETSSIQLSYFHNSHSAVLSTFVDMVEVSEHGIAIRYKIPFKEGTFMRFISSIFYMDNGDPIIGRCYFSEVDPNDPENYVSYFEFFGVTDEVFKRIRVWIRENYIHSKQAS